MSFVKAEIKRSRICLRTRRYACRRILPNGYQADDVENEKYPVIARSSQGSRKFQHRNFYDKERQEKL